MQKKQNIKLMHRQDLVKLIEMLDILKKILLICKIFNFTFLKQYYLNKYLVFYEAYLYIFQFLFSFLQLSFFEKKPRLKNKKYLN